MFHTMKYGLLCFTFILISCDKCTSEVPPPPPSLVLFSPGEEEYTEVVVKRVHDNLTLVCAARGETNPTRHVWNYLPERGTVHRPLAMTPSGLTFTSRLEKVDLQLEDSGQYICSAPPFSVNRYLLVQERGPIQCARGAFTCGKRCVLPTYVCDGHVDCLKGEDEAPELCGTHQPCAGGHKLNCSSGRCIAAAACCRLSEPVCRQPHCCTEHYRYSSLGYDVEYPALFEDRHAPDDYGFIQSTIYTVTACALIFMIAVVLLVSAICKMHMKRAALRGYRAPPTTLYQTHQFPPCYEASRLLEQARGPASPARSPATPSSPVGEPMEQSEDCPEQNAESPRGGLARIGAMFYSRYRQVPTQSEVEMTDVRCSSLNNSPTRNQRPQLNNYRSPTYCDLNSPDFQFTNPESAGCGRDLNYMATPIEFFRRRTLTRNNPIDRIIDHINTDRPRSLTLQLGRFQLSIPRFGRTSNSDIRRPDTPNVAEINIDDLDFVRLNSNETYTLNGRTIRLLGANFENYPNDMSNTTGPPPYNEAIRYKLYGPPPEYLSRDTLNVDNNENINNAAPVAEDATNNVEMPPRYEDLASGVDRNANNETVTSNIVNTLSAYIDNLPAIDSDCNANDSVMDNAISLPNSSDNAILLPNSIDNCNTLPHNVESQNNGNS